MNLFSNRLALETSPYLLQHANNPVDWYPWSDEAFNKAKTEKKLILVSIGYSSCHWCHVMEREAFSNPEVTDFMNTHFINIKVDREERPDIDQIYMNAVQIINRRGGWPLNCFALPNGKPVFGGTYFSTENWLNILKSLNDSWQKEPDRFSEVADELAQSIIGSEIIRFKRDPETQSSYIIKDYSNRLKRLFDTRNGGIKGAPKFPMPGLLEFLLEYGTHEHDEEINNFVALTLDKIALGGIYDHLGGGFARYSVDENWHIPHFEKMLYDNAQLISLYSKAYRITQNELYKSVVKESISFITSEMRSNIGGFFASYDADSEGKEGAYYTWTKHELEVLLGEDAELFSVAYGVTAAGNFDSTNVLYRCASKDHLKSLFSIECATAVNRITRAKKLLLEVRSKRIKPSLDDKVIISWNGMLVSALTDAFISFGNPSYLKAAINCLNYIEDNHYSNAKLKRIHCKGKLSVDALLDDYANLIKAYISVFKVTLNREWVSKAEALLKAVINDFYDKDSGMFFFSPSYQTDLIARKMDLTDGVISSSGSVMAQNLFDLGEILKNEEYVIMSNQMLANITESLEHGGPYVFGWARLMHSKHLPAVHLKINSIDNINLLNQIQRKVICPVLFPSIADKQSLSSNPLSNQANIKICIGNTCYPSANDPDYYTGLINSIKL